MVPSGALVYYSGPSPDLNTVQPNGTFAVVLNKIVTRIKRTCFCTFNTSLEEEADILNAFLPSVNNASIVELVTDRI